MRRIHNAHRSNATLLSLQGLQIAALPPAITTLTSLHSLSLAHNQFTTLPTDQLAQLPQLTYLLAPHNQLTSFPSAPLPPTLQVLDLRNNQVCALLSKDLLTLSTTATHLTVLTLHNNLLTALPREIGLLTSLRSLGLYNNQLTTLPSEIGQLTALRHLSLSRNHLHTLPPSIGNLTSLRKLFVSYNNLRLLPHTIGRLTSLRELYLEGNKLRTESLPLSLAHLSQTLTTLMLDGNPYITHLPPTYAHLRSVARLSVPSYCYYSFTTTPHNHSNSNSNSGTDGARLTHTRHSLVRKLMHLCCSAIIRHNSSAHNHTLGLPPSRSSSLSTFPVHHFDFSILPLELQHTLENDGTLCAGCEKVFFGPAKVYGSVSGIIGADTDTPSRTRMRVAYCCTLCATNNLHCYYELKN
eukprot:TRINITY_DN7347_c0_g1_i5.p1 TRINITY_DN7347_c0_g1~~TRINITY_DN7347_c0_g1_i5.p1  ORF type:complete len:410 (+),score=74.33 TRINITY_DN7347_c0_g1_i5:492-1721(+)